MQTPALIRAIRAGVCRVCPAWAVVRR